MSWVIVQTIIPHAGAVLQVPELALQFLFYEELRKCFCSSSSSSSSTVAQQGGCAPGSMCSGNKGCVRVRSHHSSGPSSCSPTQHLLLGGTAGAAAALCTTPLDVIKTTMQCDGARSVTAAVQQVLLAKGPGGLWCGVGPRVMMTTVSCAIFFALFETAKAQAQQWQQQQGAPGQGAGRAQVAAQKACPLRPVYRMHAQSHVDIMQACQPLAVAELA